MFIRITIALTFLALTCHAQSKLLQFQDSLAKLAQNPKNTTAIGTVLSDIGGIFLGDKNYDSARRYYFKALQWNQLHGLDTLVGLNLNDLGLMHDHIGEPDSAIWYFEHALLLQRKLKDNRRAGNTLVNMGIYYKDRGFYEESLQASFDAAIKLEPYPWSRELASCYNTIGTVYGKVRNYEQALLYLRKSLQIRRTIGYQRGVGLSYNNLGNVFVTLKQYDSALHYFTLSLQVKQALNDKAGTASTLHNIGEVYYNRGEYILAEARFHESLGWKERIQDPVGIALTLTALGRTALARHQLNDAQVYLSRGETIAVRVKALDVLRDNYAVQQELYEVWKDPHRALEYSRKLLLVSDSILSVRKSEELSEKNISYKIRQQVQGLQNTLALQDAEIQNKRLWIGGLILGVILLSIIGALITNQWRTVDRSKKRVEILLQELHHRVKNNLQMLSSVFTLQAEMVTDATALEAIRSSEGRVNAMALIHRKLYNKSDNHRIELNSYITELTESIAHSFRGRQVAPKLNISIPTIYLDVDKSISIGLIVNELVTNAFKYAFDNTPQPKLHIAVSILASKLLITIQDNGHGMADAPASAHSFGLKLVNILVRDLKGGVTVDVQDGTTFTITLPHP